MFIAFLLLGYIAGLASAVFAWWSLGFSALASLGIMSLVATIAVFAGAGLHGAIRSLQHVPPQLTERALPRRLKAMVA
jgi:hypothetical protein